ncbi:A disintegrin and metalloproteinase with thrombospondin motifs 13 [Lates japonicus]|uniref:A disintegrin and metalloproteinase with thrombospondin motifs 13 n=1 Tax=Lates japonicus TaxID=270547 RepID=A0AAD3R256_LATJO|nr:A disintegrin and metalloproteinase with thrombospondin motifs 13 [Lates japonicus]
MEELLLPGPGCNRRQNIQVEGISGRHPALCPQTVLLRGLCSQVQFVHLRRGGARLKTATQLSNRHHVSPAWCKSAPSGGGEAMSQCPVYGIQSRAVSCLGPLSLSPQPLLCMHMPKPIIQGCYMGSCDMPPTLEVASATTATQTVKMVNPTEGPLLSPTLSHTDTPQHHGRLSHFQQRQSQSWLVDHHDNPST